MKKNLFILAVAGLALASCSNDETVATSQASNEISFRPLMTGVTRSADIAIGNLTSFNVTAYTTDVTPVQYFDDVTFSTTDGTPSSSSTYTSVNKYYWPSSGTLSFYAYAPTDGAPTTTASSWNQITRSDYKTFIVKPSTKIEEQADLIYACNKSVSKTTAGVPLTFRHAGAKIICKVKNSSTTLKFAVDGWKVGFLKDKRQFALGDAEVTSSAGTFAFADWTDITGTGATTRVVGNEYASTWSTATGIAAKAASGANPEHVTVLDGEMILVPQRVTAATGYQTSGTDDHKLNNAFIAVKLKIMNDDASSTIIASETGGVTMWAIWPIGDDGSSTFNWEPGKKYTYTVDLAGGGYYEVDQNDDGTLDQILAGAEIKFVGVTVDSWTPYDGDGNSSADADGDSDNTNDPIDVGM